MRPTIKEASLTADFVQDDRNANKGTVRGKGMLDRSISDLGFGRPILADKHHKIIAGNKTAQAVAEAGMTNAIVIESDGTRPIVHVRTDLDLGDRKGKARVLAHADNWIQKMDYEIDEFVLAEDIESGAVPDWLGMNEAKNIASENNETVETLGLSFKLVITCNTEEEQQQLLTEMETRGIECKAMII